MHVAFLSNPASGEVNVQLATAQELVSQGHRVTLLSGDSCSSKVDRLRKAQHPRRHNLIHFIALGSARTVDDVTDFIQERMPLMRRAPGDPVSLETCLESALGPAEEHAATAVRVRDHLDALDPDMICVDALTPILITGVRLTGRKYILTVPCSPGMTALPGLFEPHCVAANRDGSWGTLLENIYLNMRCYIHSRTNPDRIAKASILTDCLKLKSYGTTADTSNLPPHWEDDNCVAGIHFNTLGLTDCPKQSPKMIFVGAGLSPSAVNQHTPLSSSPEQTFLDTALLHNDDVVYMNMGSMFIWQRHEFFACIEGFEAASQRHKALTGRGIRFLFKINFPLHSTSTNQKDAKEPLLSKSELLSLPASILLTTWIPNQTAIYSHPALKAFIHHGGGNSFNEAVYFGVPQLVLSQWLDTHEYANYAVKFGLGLKSERPPWIEKEDIEEKILCLVGERWGGFKRSCREWSVRCRVGGGVRAAARLVLGFAGADMNMDVDLEQVGDTGIDRVVDVNNARGGSLLTPPFSPVESEVEVEMECIESDDGKFKGETVSGKELKGLLITPLQT
ncbi:hypothetical protein BJY04DRAFT_212725 [Aspergillus karnatakaensis]|uniref:glycosyltransferase n=1 Tax=Aspergillus karnatakaensis TaxID=1810916 RepID=UPI003CCE30E5